MTVTRAEVIAKRWWMATFAVIVAATLAAGAAGFGHDSALRHPLALLAFPICMAQATYWNGWVKGHKAANAQPSNLEAQK